ncbi:ExbD/TolR family protein [Spirochaeta isovalerica]|uniref:Biopolymer transport protein ExbD n=1 Tax=Spirochaeta isovalerica TaxID=150 RepID=A0A841RGU6_9SPIO|nr:biopolymer transporter ExbD [Spirochaeta isovalerica]MBB6482240.1 biopolymer transport protein ExbD [Spirochaeta isovalerica]
MKFQRRLKPQVVVDLTPLIDVVFQLVVFFMVSSVFNTSPGIELELPESSTTTSVAITEMIITVENRDTVYLNSIPYTMETLPDAVASFEFDPTDEGENVVLESAKDIPYQMIITILDVLRYNGYDAVSLVTLRSEVDE